MNNQDDILFQPHDFEPDIEVALVIYKPVTAKQERKLPELPISNVIRGKTTSRGHEVWNNIPPKIGGRGIAMQEKNNRVSLTPRQRRPCLYPAPKLVFGRKYLRLK